MNKHTTTELDYGTGQKTLSVYLFGVVSCVILTLIAFWSVITTDLSRPVIFLIIFSSAILQFFIQITCFLRLNIKTEQGQLNVIAFIYTIMILICILFGSLWIMWNLGYYMNH